jgi:hypothetical protein
LPKIQPNITTTTKNKTSTVNNGLNTPN